ncbi:MAG TPA: hypothetical protein VKB78_14030, partial [Pirellulales bacterium]|nr:hypothetical protein [Pirellulales bacterium]
DPALLIREGLLEPLEDFEHKGTLILASRLGYRITRRFVGLYFGRVFDNPAKVLDDAILRPETQDLDSFADGVKYITEAQRRIATKYFDDGSYALACPPLRALLELMVAEEPLPRGSSGEHLRRLFTRQSLLESNWYHDRLKLKQRRDVALWRRHLDYLEQFGEHVTKQRMLGSVDLAARRRRAEAELARVASPRHLDELVGTPGANPLKSRAEPRRRANPQSASTWTEAAVGQIT